MKHASRTTAVGVLFISTLLVGAGRQAGSHSAAVKYRAYMDGSNAVPSNNEVGFGTANLVLDGTTISYAITVTDLTSVPLQATIGGPNIAGGVVREIVMSASAAGAVGTRTRVASGKFDLTKAASAKISADSLMGLLNSGNLYVSVSTAAHPAGEIRGQVTRQ